MNLNKKPKYLYVSTEHGKLAATGGIGSYIAEVYQLLPEEVLVLVCINDNQIPKSERDWLVLNDFFDQKVIETTDFLVIAAKAVQIIMEQFKSIQKIEIQEYYGIAAILLHLQRNKLFSINIPIVVHCHGSSRYIESNITEPLKPEKIDKVYAEKVAIELTNNLRFPTKFLYDSYLKFDYTIESEKVFLKRYPFNFPDLKSISYQPIDTLIFFGKRNAMKGFKEFTAAIQILSSQTFFINKVKKIVLLGPAFGCDKENYFFKELANRFSIEEMSLSREKSLAFISENSSHALCILPYRGDNHPVSVLEVVSCQCPIIAANAGGIPELIPERFHNNLLCNVKAVDLANKIEDYLKLEPTHVEHITTAVFQEMNTIQVKINEDQFIFAEDTLKNVNDGKPTASLAKFEIEDSNSDLSIDDFSIKIQHLDCDFVVLSKIGLSTLQIEKITNYVNNNSTIEAGIVGANPMHYEIKHPMLGDGLPVLFLNKNYILSKVLYIKKSRLIAILSLLNAATKIDSYFLVTLLFLLKKENTILGVVYMNEEEVILREDILDNDSYKLLSIFSEIGLNNFDSDRIYKLLSYSASNGNSLITVKNKKSKLGFLFRIKRKLKYLISKRN
jgi:glycosyltransferase involved in cell wall biosynthesis